jgi:hypothetical protein
MSSEPARRSRRSLTGTPVGDLVLALCLVLTVLWHALDFAAVERGAAWILLGYLLLACAGLPLRFAIATAIAMAGLNVLLVKASATKVALTQLPLTFLDLQLAARDPGGLVDALGAPRVLTHVLVAAAVILGALLVALSLRVIWRTVRAGRTAIGSAAVRAFVPLLPVICAVWFGSWFAAKERLAVQTIDEVWEPRGVTALSQRIGIVPFLAFSYSIQREDTGDYFRRESGAEPPDPAVMMAVLGRYVRRATVAGDVRPNIIVFQAESTFDPNRLFALTRPVVNPLFTDNASTRARGPLHVNAVGGGSWRTEWETVTGLDYRLFGYSGYYTHSSLSPYVHRTLATYLRERGYMSHAFYSSPGDFYNVRNAYGHYGFDHFYDSADLGRGQTWSRSDIGLAEDLIRTLGSHPKEPFYAVLVSAENHSPHPCTSFTSASQFVTTFAATNDFQLNCTLNEYVLRLSHTGAAFERLGRYLASIEAATGRPFVLVAYGDHLPHTFSSEPSADAALAIQDFSKLRRRPLTETDFHLMSSSRVSLNCCREAAPPASLLPTLVSAFVERNAMDLYLPVNLFLYSRCGSDFMAGAESWGLYGGARAAGRRPPGCADAYDAALATYRRDHLFGSR